MQQIIFYRIISKLKLIADGKIYFKDDHIDDEEALAEEMNSDDSCENAFG